MSPIPWFKVDDGFSTSKAVLRIPRRYRAAAVGLWTLAGSWSAKELTDGFVPRYTLDELSGTEALATRLVDAELWSRVDGGWLFNGWPKYQPTKEQVEAERAKAAERVRKWRENKGKSRDGNGVTEPLVTRNKSVSNGVVTPPPSRPVPTRPDPTSISTEHATNFDAWQPNDKHRALAASQGIDATDQAERFRDYIASTGKKYKDLDRAFNNWLKNAKQFSGRQTKQQEVDGTYQRAMARARGEQT